MSISGFGFRSFVASLCLGSLLISCSTTDEQQLSLQNLSDQDVFERVGTLYTQDEAGELIEQGLLGTDAENAFVPLMFSENGGFLSVEEANSVIKQRYPDMSKYRELYTNYATYEDAMKQLVSRGSEPPSRLPDTRNAGILSLGPSTNSSSEVESSSNDSVVYAYDPFQTTYEVGNDFMTQNLTAAATLPSTTNVRVGDIAFTRSSKSGITGAGHTGLVMSTRVISSDAAVFPRNSSTAEAVGYKSNNTEEIAIQRATVSFNTTSGSRIALAKVKIGTTDADQKRQAVRSYHSRIEQRNQAGEVTYAFPSGKATSDPNRYTTVYCSLLHWKAYMWITGIDIDANGGLIVYPIDIKNDREVETVWTYNF